MVFPLEITATIGGAWPVGTKLNWQFTENGHEIYYAENAPYLWHSIKVNPLTNVWSDHGTHDPTPDGVVEETIDGVVYVALYYDNPQPLLLKFPKPTVASWITGQNLYPLGAGTGLPTQLNYNPGNLMHYLVRASELSTDMLSTRNLYYRVRNATVPNPSTDININHTEGTQTQGYFNPTVYGVYHLERVITNPLEVHSFDSREVTQANIDAWNAANNTPPNTPRSRRGNLNFW